MNLKSLPFPIYGNQKYRGKCPLESAEQITFFNQLRKAYPETWGALALHPRNEQQLRGGQHRGMIKQKAEGMTPGASDVVIPGRIAFVCEIKRIDHTQSKWQPGQVEYLTAAHEAGAFACVALGWQGAWDALSDWLEVLAATET